MPPTEKLIADAIGRIQGEVPQLANLKLVLGLELTSGGLTGPGKSDEFRIEVPGPKVTAGEAEDARHFGHLKVRGDPRVKRVLGRAIEPAL